MRHRYFVLTPYGVIKIKSLSYNNFIKQCEANVHNVFGGVPACYKQAAQLMHNLQQLVQMDGEWNGYRFSTSGHSLGGGLAAYAALKVSSKENVILAEWF